MKTITREALVPYSPKQMFDLVNDIEKYPEFLPWCQAIEVKSRTDVEVVAAMTVAKMGVKKEFSTRNILTPYSDVKILLEDGPLKQLEGDWHFEAIGDAGCKVMLTIAFDLSGNWASKLFEPFFTSMANTMVENFCSRAEEVYQKQSS